MRIGFANSDSSFIDDAVLLFGDDTNISDTSYTIYDTHSLNTSEPQFITTIKNGMLLSVNTMSTPLFSDSINLNVHSSATGNFLLRFSDYELFDGNISINLWDKYLNKVVDVRANPVYLFTTSSDTNSMGSNRFELIFNKSNTLAMDQIVLTAAKENGAIELVWHTSLPGSDNFIVEASTDGRTFSTIGTSKGIDSLSRYTFNVSEGANKNDYFRIKGLDKTGQILYSNVVFVQSNLSIASISVYPNPLTSKVLSVYLNGIAAGKYKVYMYDMLGKEVEQLPLNHSGINQNYVLILQNKLPAGIYRLIIKDINSGSIVSQSSVEVK